MNMAQCLAGGLPASHNATCLSTSSSLLRPCRCRLMYDCAVPMWLRRGSLSHRRDILDNSLMAFFHDQTQTDA
jgi:hypothetical protein